jgi:hypothetical protein
MPSAKPITDQIALLKAKKDRLASKLNALEAKAKQQDRKRDTHRRIVVGTAVLAHIAQDAEFADMVRLILSVSVTSPADRALISDLLDDAPTPAAAAPNEANGAAATAQASGPLRTAPAQPGKPAGR